jgi:uncharacterized protein (DUF362 family)
MLMECTGIAAATAAARPGLAQEAPAVPETIDASYKGRSTVALIHGEDRRKNVYDALTSIEERIAPKIKQKKYVLVKPNCVWARQLAGTHPDALRGVLDFLEPYRKPVVIAESSATQTRKCFEEFRYEKLLAEYKDLSPKLIDLNEEGLYVISHALNDDLHPVPVRLAKRLTDPDAFILSVSMLKTHNGLIATMSVKNMTMGAPLHYGPKDTEKWSDKGKFHSGVRQTNYGLMITAMKISPFWGATVIDGLEGMEGKGPIGGTPVQSNVALASTDYIAADRVGLEAMGIDPSWVGYLQFCHKAGIGQYDLSKIDLVGGVQIASIRKQYEMAPNIDTLLKWRGAMTELPPILR